MVWWLEQIEASGYNRYVMLKMTHNLKWVAPEGEQTQWGYFYGPGKSKIIDAVKSSKFPVKVVFIDSPANPLGIVFKKEELEK